MKLLLLCYEYPPVGGGGGRVAAQVAAGLAKRGHEVKVATAGLKHLPRREERDGVEIFRPESFRKREDTCSVPEMALYLATGFLPAWGLARKWKPDVLHAHFAVPTGPLTLGLHLFTRVPYVLTAHLGDVPGGVPEQTDHLFRLVDPFVKPVWKKAARVTAVSRFVADLAGKAYGIQPEVIPNGVRPVANSAPKNNPAPRLLMVGRLSIQKNPLLAIEALARVRHLPWTFDVIGEGPLGEDMRRRAAELGLAERITFHGWLSSEEVGRLMEAGDILLMTSLHEGLPMVAIEALQHGLAVVGSAIGGMQDVVDEGRNGLLAALTPEDFARALGTVLEDPARLRAFQQGSQEKAPQFDLERIVDRYESVLLEAAGRVR